ncbi:MAG: anti-sigma factor [Actinomycetota bacterium]|nr:anti-sigma factor [Actinomycetota bacterium]
MSPHEGIRMDLAAYLAHELPGRRAIEVQKHLADCPVCMREAEELRDLTALVRSTPLEHEPPPHLERQVMALIELDRAVGDPIELQDEPAEQRPHRSLASRWPALVAAGFAAAGVALAILNVQLRDRALVAEDRNQAWVDVYGSWGESVREVHLSGRGLDRDDVVATFIHHGGANYGISMRSEGLRSARPGSKYEVWLSDDEGWISTGSFEISPDSDRVFYFHLGEDPRAYDKIWVTVEPHDGDPGPSGRAVAQADLDI